MRAWAGYIRVSFVGGRAGDSFRSPTDQAKVIEAWAASRGHTVVMLEPELDGKGNDPNRVILNQAIQGVRDGEFAGIVVAYLSRAARDLRLTLDLWHEVESAGGEIACATENIDASTIEGRMTRNILASVAQAERERQAASFERQAESATERGVWQRRQFPKGYTKDPETRRLVPNEAAGKVRRAFVDRAAGVPLVKIAAELGMSPQGTRHLLANRVYLGELRVRSYVNPVAHPPIVTVEEFDAAQTARRVRPAREDLEPALLASLVRCAGCGHVMTRSSGGNRSGGVNRVYACTVFKSAGRCPSPASIATGRLDDHMGRLAVLKLAELSVHGSRDTSKADAVRDRLETARKDLQVFLTVTGSAGLDHDTLSRGVQERQDAIRCAETELRTIMQEGRLPAVDDPQALWESLGVGERGQLLRGLVEAVIVRRTGRGHVVPVAERVRVVRFGAGVFEGKAGSERAHPIVGVWPALDDPRVLWVAGT